MLKIEIGNRNTTHVFVWKSDMAGIPGSDSDEQQQSPQKTVEKTVENVCVKDQENAATTNGTSKLFISAILSYLSTKVMSSYILESAEWIFCVCRLVWQWQLVFALRIRKIIDIFSIKHVNYMNFSWKSKVSSDYLCFNCLWIWQASARSFPTWQSRSVNYEIFEFCNLY